MGDNWTEDNKSWLTFVAVYEDAGTTPDPDPDPDPDPNPDPDEDYQLYGLEKALVDDRDDAPDWIDRSYGISYPYRGTVVVDEGENVTLLYTLTVTGEKGAEYTITDNDATIYSENGRSYGDRVTGVLGSGEEDVYYAIRTFDWREIRSADDDELTNTARVIPGDDTTGPRDDTAVETVDVEIDWDDDDPRPPKPDDDEDKDDEDDGNDEEIEASEREYEPAYLNTDDHFAYLTGYNDGTIRPTNEITRAEVATIFFRLLADEIRETYWSQTSGYSDVTAGDWYNNAVSTLQNMGVIGGYPDGTFRPNATITRAEFVTIATRFFSYTARYEGIFTDVSASMWCADDIQAGVELGLVGGYPDGTFDPNGAITRAEACAIVNRVLGRAPDAGHLLVDMIRWPDNPETAWYYADVQEATNSHDYTHAGTGSFEVWTELLPNRDWAALEAAWSQAGDAPGGEVMG